MTREEELKQIKKESAEIEKHMNDMFDLAFMLNNRNDIMNPQAHYEKLSRMVTHYMGSIQQSYGYMSIKVIEALEQEQVLEQEPCIEPLERLAESASKTAKALERLDILDEIRVEIDRQRKWLLQAGYTAYNLDIAFNSIKSVIERGRYDV